MPSHEAVWSPQLHDLCAALRNAARGAIGRAQARDDLSSVAEPVRQGAGDVTYAIDEVTELAVDAWMLEIARKTPLSVMTEDAGWRHFGPGRDGRATELAGFDHGGPRIALDPIDGTRNLMADMRAAWSVVSFAPPGAGEPHLSDVSLGIVSEIPDSRAARYRVLEAVAGGNCFFELRELEGGRGLERHALTTGDDARVDRGYFPFFRYAPDQRPALAAIEADFFARLAAHEGADLRHVFDDQYISNAGQLTLLALGTYRMIVDIRGWLARRAGGTTITSKPYDVAGAIVCAQAAGCIVTAPFGEPLDFPIDCKTALDFIGFANAATARRIAPHLDAALGRQ